ncbi:unnamed protein product [Polarella glacialis]|uniref:SnoaL-like domain-containing protein n=1 Tax=Polarella glacialis TaxID=89957 RepID=A0A813HQZ8_POLGL|nr:unnamed protein product [Polarella glacialis]
MSAQGGRVRRRRAARCSLASAFVSLAVVVHGCCSHGSVTLLVPTPSRPPLAAQYSEIATALQAYFDGLHSCDVARFQEAWHPEGRLYGKAPDGTLIDRDAGEFCAGIAARDKSEHLSEHDRINTIDVLSDSCAYAKVQIAMTPSPVSSAFFSGDVLYTDFLVLHKLNCRWQIISKVFSAAPLGQASYREKLEERMGPIAGPLGESVREYFRGGHLSSPEVVAKSFHPNARLCFADASGNLTALSREAFFQRLTARPATPEDASQRFDKIVSVDKAGPDVAIVKLQIGYPPWVSRDPGFVSRPQGVLYTDVLSMMRLGPVGEGHWWIVAKSSESVPFPSGPS